jgi:hypothetical protein
MFYIPTSTNEIIGKSIELEVLGEEDSTQRKKSQIEL